MFLSFPPSSNTLSPHPHYILPGTARSCGRLTGLGGVGEQKACKERREEELGRMRGKKYRTCVHNRVGSRERCLLGGGCGTQVSSVGMSFALGSSVGVGRGLLREGGKDTTKSLRPVPRIGQRNGDGLRADECHVFSVYADYLLLNIKRVKSYTYYHLCSC